MYDLPSTPGLLTGLIALAMIIIFFLMYFKISKIHKILEGYAEIEFKKPEYQKKFICWHCKEEVSVSIIEKGAVNCPNCKAINKA